MSRSLWRRVLGLSDVAGAKHAMAALLVECRPLAPERSRVSAIVEAYGLSGRGTRTVCMHAFACAVEAAVADANIEQGEYDYLEATKSALSISDTESQTVFDASSETTLRGVIDGALTDHVLSAEEKTRLRTLAANLRVSTATLTRLTQEPAQRILQHRADEILADQRLSPDDERELRELARSVGGALTLDAGTEQTLGRYRLLWQLDNGILPTINAPIALQRGEVCHHAVAVQWLEPRRVTTSVSYAGVDASIRIVRGVRFRIGNVTPVRHTTDRLTRIDAGTLYITSKRLILRGATRNITVRLASVLSFEVYANGVEVQKASGRPPFIELDPADIEVTSAVFGAVLATVSA